MTTKSKSTELAERIIETANRYGMTLNPSGGILRVTKRLGSDRNAEFAYAESGAWAVLSMIPQTEPGSTWGTDGLSVGGLSALESGNFIMNKSGCSKRVLAALRKLLA